MLDIFELSPIDEKDHEEITEGIVNEIIRAYMNFVITCEDYKDEIKDFLNNKN